MTSRRRATVITVRLDTGMTFSLGFCGVVEVTLAEALQDENVRLQNGRASYGFQTITALFRALAAHEGARPTRN